MQRVAPVLLFCGGACGHGHMLDPPSRQGGELAMAGQCWKYGQCYWFSQSSGSSQGAGIIPGKPTLPDYARTVNVNVTSGDADWTRKMPWRAPGTAPVYGSGCGTAGGGPQPYGNGGDVHRITATWAPNVKQGDDSLDALPPLANPTKYTRGTTVEMTWSMHANHGGGYSYRLCPKSGKISEECFLRTVLNMSGSTQFYQIGDDKSTRREIPRTTVTEGTFPAGSMWASVGIPACGGNPSCDGAGKVQQTNTLGCPYAGEPGCPRSSNGCLFGTDTQVTTGDPTTFTCGAGGTQFPPPFPEAAVGFGGRSELCTKYRMAVNGLPWNIIDKVEIPAEIPAGDYQLSWRYDCEQSTQVWQTCADVTLE